MSKIAACLANSVDSDEMPRSVASHLSLHCLLRPVCPNISLRLMRYNRFQPKNCEISRVFLLLFFFFILFGFEVTFNNLSVISGPCLDMAGISMLTCRVVLH